MALHLRATPALGVGAGLRRATPLAKPLPAFSAARLTSRGPLTKVRFVVAWENNNAHTHNGVWALDRFAKSDDLVALRLRLRRPK